MPTGLSGRLLALTLFLVVLGSLYLLAAVPLVDFYAERAAALERREMLAPRLDALAAELPALRARLAALHAQAQTRKVTLDGSSDAIASANLESRIEALAVSVGATIGSTEALPAETRGPYRRIGLRVILSGTYETVVKLIAALEETNPPLVIDDLQLHGVLRRAGLPGPQGINGTLDVYGFRANQTAAAAKR
ncbi:MAG TPA: type II secretion system protein GspM [Stellaceae bacterium]|nr:type II secretion system protein GspM [Stellaceae bacterium]